jgi:hypothetical protein
MYAPTGAIGILLLINGKLTIKQMESSRYKTKILTVMITNSSNINKTNNHLSHPIMEHKETKTYCAWNPGLGSRQAHTWLEFKPVNRIPSPIMISEKFDFVNILARMS